jgi:hypothetical protein
MTSNFAGFRNGTDTDNNGLTTNTQIMSAFKPATRENVVDVIRRFADFIEKDNPEALEGIADEVNAFLDGLHDQDFFGTEGQCDPRGDHRE